MDDPLFRARLTRLEVELSAVEMSVLRVLDVVPDEPADQCEVEHGVGVVDRVDRRRDAGRAQLGELGDQGVAGGEVAVDGAAAQSGRRGDRVEGGVGVPVQLDAGGVEQRRAVLRGVAARGARADGIAHEPQGTP